MLVKSLPDQKLLSNWSDSIPAFLIMRRLLKMIDHEETDAASKISMTSCTGKLACITRLKIDMSVPMEPFTPCSRP